jgi:hypothetical protein
MSGTESLIIVLQYLLGGVLGFFLMLGLISLLSKP